MSDTEYLISCVEAHPCVWDPALAEYHDREKKEAAWLEICRAVVPRWQSLTEQERTLKRLELKKKWSNCRDYYKKDMQRSQQPSPAADRRRRRYVFAEHLSFLERIIKGPEETNESFVHEQKPEEILIVEVGEEGKETKKKKIQSIDANSDKTKISQEMFSEILNMPNKEPYRSHSDDDEKFLLSFRGDMRKMTHSQKIDFKLGMVKLVKNIFQDGGADAACSSSHRHAHSSTFNADYSPEYILEDDSPSDS